MNKTPKPPEGEGGGKDRVGDDRKSVGSSAHEGRGGKRSRIDLGMTLADDCYHVLNRGNAPAQVFHKPADFGNCPSAGPFADRLSVG